MRSDASKPGSDAGFPAAAAPVTPIELPVSLRDYFAAQALPSVVSRWPDGHPHGWHGIAAGAYLVADAMLEARAYVPRDEHDDYQAHLFREAARELEAAHTKGPDCELCEGHCLRDPGNQRGD